MDSLAWQACHYSASAVMLLLSSNPQSPMTEMTLQHCIVPQTAYLRNKLNVVAHVVAISNSRKMVLSQAPLQGSDWQAALANVSAATSRCTALLACTIWHVEAFLACSMAHCLHS